MRTDIVSLVTLGLVCGANAAAPTFSCFDPPDEGQTNPLGEGMDIVESECCEALTDDSDIEAERRVVWDPVNCNHGPGDFPITEEPLCRAHDTDGCRFCRDACDGTEDICVLCSDIDVQITTPAPVTATTPAAPVDTPAPITPAAPTGTPAPITPAAPVDTPAPITPVAPTGTPGPITPVAPTGTPAPITPAAPVDTPAPITPAAPTGTPGPITPVAPTGTPAPITPAAPTGTPGPITPAAPTGTPAPITPAAPVDTPAPITPVAPTTTVAPTPIVNGTSTSETFVDDCGCVENMSLTEAEVIATLGKALVCDLSCSDGSDLVWGVINCNYFGLGQNCRACADICTVSEVGTWLDEHGDPCKPCSAIAP